RPVSPNAIGNSHKGLRFQQLSVITSSAMRGVPLNQQNRSDLLTIRDTFLLSQAEHGKLVVHGRTPSVVPEIRSNCVGLDTAAYATGRLTCLVLEKDQRRFLHVTANDHLRSEICLSLNSRTGRNQ